MEFEWDDNKNIENLKKHGIAFEDVIDVFSDPYLIVEFDDEHSETEDRYIAIGYVEDILYVVYTIREYGVEEVIRLISARPAEEPEIEKYLLITGDSKR